mmetsp:Transcript_16151/g.47087  ORF Transcript_16151/g.47087 Transcript_16151/m.47087 type:complete len:81 (+) Transcript_16151:127-369(+)
MSTGGDQRVAVRVPPQLSLWSIGAGFEGTASDWTEYVVWLVGFIALIWFVWSRNVMALPDDDLPDDIIQSSPSPDASKED